jgi:hypothetical protein
MTINEYKEKINHLKNLILELDKIIIQSKIEQLAYAKILKNKNPL